MGMPPAKKGTSPIVWILLIVGGLMLAGVLCIVGFTWFVVHKAKQAGFDPELMKSNPGLAVSKMVTAFNPDVEVLNTDDREGTITIRDRKTGKVAKLSFDDVKNGHFNMKVTEDGKTSTLDIGENVASKLPPWVPVYPGAKINGGLSATSSDDNGNAGTFTFTTNDSADSIRTFYENKGKDANMQVSSTASGGFGSVVTLTDSGTHRTIGVTIVGGGPATVSVTYSTK